MNCVAQEFLDSCHILLDRMYQFRQSVTDYFKGSEGFLFLYIRKSEFLSILKAFQKN